MTPERIYLDHAATTPVLPEARAAMLAALDGWANPSSPHADGRRARAVLEDARARFNEALGWRHDVIFTSGATEAIALAASRAKVPGRVQGATEHDAVPAAMGRAKLLPVLADGTVDMAALAALLDGDPALVAVQQVNNETGVVQPLAEVARLVREAGSLLLADYAQGAGKLDLPDADFIAVSGHKFGAPPGIGALLVRNPVTLRAAGGQERGYRRGTENLPGITAMTAALQARAFAEAMPRLRDLRSELEQAIVEAGGIVIAGESERVATIGAYALQGLDRTSQLVQLDLAGVSVSAGSACSSGSMKPSRVLAAMQVPAEVAESTIRVSFGPDTQSEHVERFLSEWRRMAARRPARAA